jgi:hypothetical protein
MLVHAPPKQRFRLHQATSLDDPAIVLRTIAGSSSDMLLSLQHVAGYIRGRATAGEPSRNASRLDRLLESLSELLPAGSSSDMLCCRWVHPPRYRTIAGSSSDMLLSEQHIAGYICGRALQESVETRPPPGESPRATPSGTITGSFSDMLLSQQHIAGYIRGRALQESVETRPPPGESPRATPSGTITGSFSDMLLSQQHIAGYIRGRALQASVETRPPPGESPRVTPGGIAQRHAMLSLGTSTEVPDHPATCC